MQRQRTPLKQDDHSTPPSSFDDDHLVWTVISDISTPPQLPPSPDLNIPLVAPKMAGDMPEEVPPVWTEEHSCGYVQINLPNRDKIDQHPHEAEETPERDETHTFPTSLPDWSNLEVLHRNTLPPRAYFFVYKNASDAYTRDVTKSRTLSLSGKWKFHLAKSPFDAPSNFFDPKFDPASWGPIKVPGMWQLQGYGKGPQ